MRLTLEDINYQELGCIFAGADRDFVWEDPVKILYDSDVYPHLMRERKMPRKFIIGDLHGCYDLFQEKLKEIGFDKEQDIMYSVGDLIDRGPDSMKCLRLLKEPWFKAVRGNHEDFLIKVILEKQEISLWIINGGGWHLDEDLAELTELAKLASELPYSITLKHKNIGICHAEAPSDDWNDTLNPSYIHKERMIWGRKVIYAYKDTIVKNIGRTFHGHSITENIVVRGNCNFIDTGAYYYGNLTCVEI